MSLGNSSNVAFGTPAPGKAEVQGRRVRPFRSRVLHWEQWMLQATARRPHAQLTKRAQVKRDGESVGLKV